MEISLGSFSSFASSTLEALAIRGVQSFSTQWNDPHRFSWSFFARLVGLHEGMKYFPLIEGLFHKPFFGIPINKPIFYGMSLVGFDHSDEDDCTVATCFCLGESIPYRVLAMQNPPARFACRKKTALPKKNSMRTGIYTSPPVESTPFWGAWDPNWNCDCIISAYLRSAAAHRNFGT